MGHNNASKCLKRTINKLINLIINIIDGSSNSLLNLFDLNGLMGRLQGHCILNELIGRLYLNLSLRECREQGDFID